MYSYDAKFLHADNEDWSDPRGYKTVFMFNSAEHEICPADKSQITNTSKVFVA